MKDNTKLMQIYISRLSEAYNILERKLKETEAELEKLKKEKSEKPLTINTKYPHMKILS